MTLKKKIGNRLIKHLQDQIGNSLDEIAAYAKKHIILDKALKGTPVIRLLQKGERSYAEHGISYACQEILENAGIGYEIRGKNNVPANGSVLYLSNHPYGLLDGILFAATVGSILSERNKEFKILANSKLKMIQGLEKVLVSVDPFKNGSNGASFRGAIKYLCEGGSLLHYPAGRISGPGLVEYPWKGGISTLVLNSDSVVPILTSGPDHSRFYNFLTKSNATMALRNALMLREVMNKRGKKLILDVGEPITAETIKEIENERQITDYVKGKCDKLKLAA